MSENKEINTDANIVDQFTILSGDRAKLKDLLCNRLTECGWRDEVRMLCRQTLRERGVSNTNVDEIIAEVTPQARSMVPDGVKKELMLKIREILSAHHDVDVGDEDL